jgi:hypothetical protein
MDEGSSEDETLGRCKEREHSQDKKYAGHKGQTSFWVVSGMVNKIAYCFTLDLNN